MVIILQNERSCLGHAVMPTRYLTCVYVFKLSPTKILESVNNSFLFTLLNTNIAPARRPGLKRKLHLPTQVHQVRTVSFRECNISSLERLPSVLRGVRWMYPYQQYPYCKSLYYIIRPISRGYLWVSYPQESL